MGKRGPMQESTVDLVAASWINHHASFLDVHKNGSYSARTIFIDYQGPIEEIEHNAIRKNVSSVRGAVISNLSVFFLFQVCCCRP